MKKVFKPILVVLAFMSLLFVGRVVCMIFEMPEDLCEYSEADMHSWISQQLDSEAEYFARKYDVDRDDIAEVQGELESYIDELMDSDAKCRYEVSSITSSVTEEPKYLELALSVEYRGLGAFEELPYAADDMQAVNYVLEVLNSGATEVFFRTGTGWNSERLGQIGDAVIYNAADIAAVAESYSYYVGSENTQKENFCNIAMEYSVDSSVLSTDNEALRAAADGLAADISAMGISDARTLCLAVAQRINSLTEYDYDMAESIRAERRSELEWAESSAYGPLIMGRSVCTGYAMAFKSVCDRLGLPCWIVNGFTEDTGHVWNMVLIEGETYYVDCTFADTSGDGSWLLMSESEYAQHDYNCASSAVQPW